MWQYMNFGQMILSHHASDVTICIKALLQLAALSICRFPPKLKATSDAYLSRGVADVTQSHKWNVHSQRQGF